MHVSPPLPGRATRPLALLLALAALLPDRCAAQDKLYWTDWSRNEINRSNLDGSGKETLLSGFTYPADVVFHPADGKLYWIDPKSKILRANTDGTSLEVIWRGETEGHFGLAIDDVQHRVYWTGPEAIRRADLDGANVEPLLTTDAYGIALDAANGYMYWTEQQNGLLRRARFDGTGATTIRSGLDQPTHIAIDPTLGMLYWVQDQGQTIWWAGLDGSDPALLLDTGTPGSLADLAFDPTSQQLYWCSFGWIYRAHADGSHQEQVSPPAGWFTYHFAIDGANQLVYWEDGTTFFSGSTDGTNKQTVLASPVVRLSQIEVDMRAGKMYWLDGWTFQRANLDGTDKETLLEPGGGNLSGLALDLDRGRFYWTDPSFSRIYRAALDGSGATTLLDSGLSNPSDLVLDLAAKKMYWCEYGSGTIKRADLDGQNAEIVLSISSPYALALDPASDRLYWMNMFTGKIQRAALDGSNLEDLVATNRDQVYLNELVLDVNGGKMYWTEYTPAVGLPQTIKRANLDGSGAEVLATSLVDAPFDLALTVENPLPVELVSFEARRDGAGVLLAWQTASETNNAGFDVEHADDGGAWERVAFVDGHGTTVAPQPYAYRVPGLAPGTHRFRLRQTDYDGAFDYSPVVEVIVELAEAFALSAPSPNPFNAQTTFTLAVERPQHVRIAVFDLLGREVARLHEGTLPAHETRRFTFDAAALSSGFYVVRVDGEAFRTARTLLLTR